MTDKEWERLFCLIEMAVNQQLPTWEEKRDAIRWKARELDGEAALAEFVGWFQE